MDVFKRDLCNTDINTVSWKIIADYRDKFTKDDQAGNKHWEDACLISQRRETDENKDNRLKSYQRIMTSSHAEHVDEIVMLDWDCLAIPKMFHTTWLTKWRCHCLVYQTQRCRRRLSMEFEKESYLFIRRSGGNAFVLSLLEFLRSASMNYYTILLSGEFNCNTPTKTRAAAYNSSQTRRVVISGLLYAIGKKCYFIRIVKVIKCNLWQPSCHYYCLRPMR